LLAALGHGERRAVILDTLAQRHPAYGELKALAAQLAQRSGASLGFITEGANAAGAYLAGAVPHRLAGGAPDGKAGLNAGAMLSSALKAYVLLGGIDPALDLAGNGAALGAAELVVAVTTHLPQSLRSVAHVVLPVGSFAETSGTYVNLEGRWQSWSAAVSAAGDSRPGWKVLRVLGNLLNLPGFDYVSSEEVRDALKAACAQLAAGDARSTLAGAMPAGSAASGAWVDLPLYQGDVLTRGSDALSKTRDGQTARSVI
jgi:NADH-quinone oxidoreductase subunit G